MRLLRAEALWSVPRMTALLALEVDEVYQV
jgi:hypothetical protein